MLTILMANKFPQNVEPHKIWYLAGCEVLFFDAPILGVLFVLFAQVMK